jgi:hypothetical protein
MTDLIFSGFRDTPFVRPLRKSLARVEREWRDAFSGLGLRYIGTESSKGRPSNRRRTASARAVRILLEENRKVAWQDIDRPVLLRETFTVED